MSAHADRFVPHLERIIGERHPDSSPASLRGTADYLRQQFTSLGLSTVSHEFSAWGRIYENVIATTPHDRDSSAAPLILAAHYDTVIGSPGADDNASALAVLLDVARLSIAPFVASFEKLSFKQTHNFQKYSPLLPLNASS